MWPCDNCCCAASMAQPSSCRIPWWAQPVSVIPALPHEASHPERIPTLYLLAALLVVSTVLALTEVCRLRLCSNNPSVDIPTTRRYSTAELNRISNRPARLKQRSLSVQSRLVPAPLIRRSSFPVQAIPPNEGSSGETTPHRVRLIRRH
jgi:hypothetical protein